MNTGYFGLLFGQCYMPQSGLCTLCEAGLLQKIYLSIYYIQVLMKLVHIPFYLINHVFETVEAVQAFYTKMQARMFAICDS